MPKTRRWREIAGDRAEESLLWTRARLAGLADVDEVQRAMMFLVALPIASRSGDPRSALRSLFGIELDGVPLGAGLRSALESWIPRDEAGARSAALRAVEAFLAGRPKAGGLFGDDPWQVWRELDGSPFCELGRLFFAFLLEKVLLDSLGAQGSLPNALPEPSPPTPSPLTNHKGEWAIAIHAYETSKIVQPFVARWYNAQVKGKVPDAGNVRWFLAHSFGKLDLEIERELGGHPIMRSRSAHRQEPLEGFG